MAEWTFSDLIPKEARATFLLPIGIAKNGGDLIAGKTEEGREAYEEVLANVRKQVRMKTTGMPLNRY